MKGSPNGTSARTAKARLILAAEAHFAKEGIEGASLRQIATEAGIANHNAVQYHFGSREGITQAIFAYRNLQMEPAREKMIAAAEANGTIRNVRTLLEIIVLPQLALVDMDGNHSYAAFVCQHLLRRHSNRFGDFGIELPKNLTITLKMLRETISFLPEPVAQRRLVTAIFMFLNILSAYTSERRANADEQFEAALDDTLEQMVTALRMPLPTAH